MNVLGIDYGRKKVGLAVSLGALAEPYAVIRYKHTNQLFRKLREVIQKLAIEKVVIGISENQMEIESRNFGKALREELGIAVDYQDETLTSFDAQSYSKDAGMKRKKRKTMEDAHAAAIMLQSYLDQPQ